MALIDQQLLAPSPEQEQAIEKQSSSAPIAGSVAAGGDAPLQKADVIAYDTALLNQRRRYGDQLTLLMPPGWLAARPC
ncbi:hypothetical protein KBY72_09715 [Cyanobium sp. BA5m-21]|uniref:hypothetical protein n=1 Tax=unclassified Cyanobium TaxID=2627006 RepID=UPI0020CBE45D|nr:MULTISPECIES: hypothetical protein [unclassified Cyanobium]MCP9904264.1 hypothetical protein [Cyanobium sp. BA5m-10]MCP9907446.1 hypothetical protein [Cyanobium sp. BA5m-21]